MSKAPPYSAAKVESIRLPGGVTERDALLCVSGRTSFELVQKAAVADFPLHVAMGAPSTFGVEQPWRIQA
jgi:formate dehydrogenase assembly factor FdhD